MPRSGKLARKSVITISMVVVPITIRYRSSNCSPKTVQFYKNRRRRKTIWLHLTLFRGSNYTFWSNQWFGGCLFYLHKLPMQKYRSAVRIFCCGRSASLHMEGGTWVTLTLLRINCTLIETLQRWLKHFSVLNWRIKKIQHPDILAKTASSISKLWIVTAVSDLLGYMV